MVSMDSQTSHLLEGRGSTRLVRYSSTYEYFNYVYKDIVLYIELIYSYKGMFSE